MLIIYSTSSNSSSRKACAWLKKRDISFTERKVNRNAKSKKGYHLTAKDIRHILMLSENGMKDLVSKRAHVYKHLVAKYGDLNNLPLSTMIDLLVKNPNLMHYPLIVGKNKMEIGYNVEDIRMFLPNNVRDAELHQLEAKLNAMDKSSESHHSVLNEASKDVMPND